MQRNFEKYIFQKLSEACLRHYLQGVPKESFFLKCLWKKKGDSYKKKFCLLLKYKFWEIIFIF